MKTAGFTLIELLLYFGLSSILLVLVGGLFISILEAKQNAVSVSSVERDGQFIFARLQHDISRADDIVQPATLGETTTVIELSIDGSVYLYSVASNQLTLSIDGEQDLLQAETEIGNFSATRLGNLGGVPSLQIQFDVISLIQETTGQHNQSYQTTIGLR